MTNNLTEEEWKKKLTDEQYRILREKGTERAFSGKFYTNHDDGIYTCAACGTELFRSETKYDSGSGWPSFYDAISKDKLKFETDTRYGMTRIEIQCANCGGHLGHVFDDGPQPTGKRYCVNSLSLDFKKK
jgi:peptide-methionine (R)-S-oxide reductase